MEKEKIRSILDKVKKGELEVNDALTALKTLPYEDMDFAKIDTHRALRTGFPEVIYCQNKTSDQIKKIIAKISETSKFIMATKADHNIFSAIKEIRQDAIFHESAKIVVMGERKKARSQKMILVTCAGTSDLPVAEETERPATGQIADTVISLPEISLPWRLLLKMPRLTD